MFGQNEIVGRSFFKSAPENSLLVTSLFFTLQGEGPFRGQPAFFVRLAKCNLACSFCDTFFDQGTWMTFEEIDRAISRLITEHFVGKLDVAVPEWVEGMPHSSIPRKMVLVVTGGEPGLQKPNLLEFFKYMHNEFDDIQIETNGTFELLPPTSRITMVVSPKCNAANHYIKPSFEVLAAATCLKFVVSADNNSPYYTIPQWAHDWANDKTVQGWRESRHIFISPMNIYNNLPQKAKELRAIRNEITLEERSTVDEVISFWEPGLLNMRANRANHEYAAAYALRHGYIFNLQIHLFASMA